MVPDDKNQDLYPGVDDDDWARTPDSTKSLVGEMQEALVGLEQQIQEWEADAYIRTLPYLLSVIRRQWLLITFVFVTTLMVTLYPASKRIPIYQSTATLLIKFGREYVYRPEIGGGEGLISGSRQAALNTEVQILRSFPLSQRVVRAIGPEKLYPNVLTAMPASQPPSEYVAAQIFHSNFFVELLRASDVIYVSFRHSDPLIAAMGVNLGVEKFKEEHLKVFSNPQATAFLEQKVADYRDKLEQAGKEIQAFQAEHQGFFLRDEGKAAPHQRATLEASLSKIHNEIVGLRDRLPSLEAEKASITQNAALFSPPDRDDSDLTAHLRKLLFMKQELLLKYRFNHPKAHGIREKIEQVKNHIKAYEATRRPNRFYQETEMAIIKGRTELASLEAREIDLELQLDQLEAELKDDLQLKLVYDDLRSKQDTIKKTYLVYLSKAEQARLSEEMNSEKIANISVIQTGLVPETPINLGKKRVIFIGILLGIITGLGSAFVVEAVKSTNRRVHENATRSAGRQHSFLPK